MILLDSTSILLYAAHKWEDFRVMPQLLTAMNMAITVATAMVAVVLVTVAKATFNSTAAIVAMAVPIIGVQR